MRAAEPKPASRLPYVPLILLFALLVAGAFLPDKRLWGINHLSFYSMPVRIVLIGLSGVCFVPAVGRWITGFCERTAERLSVATPLSVVAGVGVVALTTFVVFHASTLLLGDGMLTANSLRFGIENEFSVGQFTSIVVRTEHISPGTDIANFIAARTGHAVGLDPLWSVRILNALIGVLFVLAVFHYGAKGDDPPVLRGVVMALMLTGGFVQFFFGYIEHYTPIALGGVVFLLIGMANAADGRRIGLAVGVVVISIAMHIFAVLFLPALLFLVITTTQRSRGAFRLTWLPVLICGLFVVSAAVSLRVPLIQRFIITNPGNSDYGILSVAHLVDIANLLLLVLPALPVVVALAVADRGSGDNDKREEIQWGFAWCLLVPALVFLLVFRPELGMARDWDLFSMTTFGVFAVAYLIVKGSIGRDERPDRGRRALLGTTVALSAVLAVGWIGINATDARALNRYESILRYDRTKVGYAYESLARYHDRRGNVRASMGAVKTAFEETGNLRYLVHLCMFYEERGDVANAIGGLFEVLRRDPDYEEARVLLVRMLEDSGDHGAILQVARDGAKQSPKNPLYPFVLGKAYLELGMIGEAKVVFQECISLNPPAAMVSEIARIVREVSGEQPPQDN